MRRTATTPMHFSPKHNALPTYPLVRNRAGRAITVLLVTITVVLLVVALMFTLFQGSDSDDQIFLTQTVERADFEAFVTEPGDVESSSNVEIRCRVRARGSSGTPILKICEEGTIVEPDDFLVQFDDSVLQQDLLQQRIAVANDRTQMIQAENDLANAKRKLREYTEGLFSLEREQFATVLFVAEDTYKRAVTYLEHSRRLHERGYITDTQLDADEFAVKKAKKDFDNAKRRLEVYDQFTKEKLQGEYEAEIKKQDARVEAATYTLELSKQKLTEIEEQIEHCLISAPATGQVVYANERDRHDNKPVIEEGTLIRENQVIIRLPDLRNMQVDVKINESHVNRINPGQAARITLDADPDLLLHGKVKEVAPYPFPIRWHGAPMEYGCIVTITDPPTTIRPGLRAKVKIIFESEPDVLLVPLAAVIEQGEQHFCLVRRDESWQPVPVTIGSNNNNQVVVVDGIAEGDQVSITPFRYIERSDLPDPPPAELATDKNGDGRSDKSPISTTSPASGATLR